MEEKPDGIRKSCRTLAVDPGRRGPLSRAADSWPPGVEESIRALEKALRGHDYAPVEALLSPRFSYAGRDGALGRTIMQQVVVGFPAGLDRIEILGVREEQDGALTVETRFHGPGPADTHQIRLSRDGQDTAGGGAGPPGCMVS